MNKPKYFKFSFPSGDLTGIARCAYDKSAKFVCGFPVAGPSFWKNENGIKTKTVSNLKTPETLDGLWYNFNGEKT